MIVRQIPNLKSPRIILYNSFENMVTHRINGKIPTKLQHEVVPNFLFSANHIVLEVIHDAYFQLASFFTGFPLYPRDLASFSRSSITVNSSSYLKIKNE